MAAYRHPTQLFSKTMLSAAVASAMFAVAPAQAFEFTLADGEVKGSFDTTLSYGVLMRADKRDSALVGLRNGGTASSANFDDGNRTYDRGDVVSSLFKMNNDLDLSYKNYGLFARTLAFYDTAVSGKQTFANGAGLSAEGEKRLADDARILDFYVRGAFDVGGKALNARLGRQVINWGESTFIPNGINVINPVDVARLRAPGSELKEGLLPQEMLWASQELTDNVSVEAFYQFKWRETRIDPRGSFFSNNDALSPGATHIFAGFGLRPDDATANRCGASGLTTLGCAQFLNRQANENPKDSGQFGLAGRILLPSAGNMEVGLYYTRYHSRTPFASGTRGGINTFQPDLNNRLDSNGNPAPINNTNSAALGGAILQAGTPVVVTSGLPDNTTTGAVCGTGCVGTNARPIAATYRAVFPEEIDLFGIGLSGTGPWGLALQGEYSYRPNQPIQLAQIEVLLAALGAPNAAGIPSLTDTGPAGLGGNIQGYREVKMHQMQGTATKSFGPQLGASQLTAVGEVGFTYLDLPDGILFEGPGANFPSSRTPSGATNSQNVNGNAYATKRSWGYRLLTTADYPNALGAWTLSPRVAFSHDVRGVSPTFNQGAQSINLGIRGNLRNQWTADLSYTGFFGGRTYSGQVMGLPVNFASSANSLKDRDFIAATVSYSF